MPAFIARYTGKLPQPGAFLNTDGDVIGTHRGIVHYTIGQRRGLGISAPQPLYVCRIDPVENTVTLGTNDALYSRTLMAKDVNLIACETLSEPTRVEAKIRYRHVQQLATAWQTEDGTLHVEFDEPQRAILADKQWSYMTEKWSLAAAQLNRWDRFGDKM